MFFKKKYKLHVGAKYYTGLLAIVTITNSIHHLQKCFVNEIVKCIILTCRLMCKLVLMKCLHSNKLTRELMSMFGLLMLRKSIMHNYNELHYTSKRETVVKIFVILFFEQQFICIKCSNLRNPGFCSSFLMHS